MDAATKCKTRPSMAKVRVEIDLLKSQPELVFLGFENDNSPLRGHVQKLEYENIPRYYKYCKKLGHLMIN